MYSAGRAAAHDAIKAMRKNIMAGNGHDQSLDREVFLSGLLAGLRVYCFPDMFDRTAKAAMNGVILWQNEFAPLPDGCDDE